VSKAKLSWFEAGSDKTVKGKLLNISAGGAAIIVDDPIPANEHPCEPLSLTMYIDRMRTSPGPKPAA